MPDYKKMYLVLFNAITDAVNVMQHYCLPDDLLEAMTELKTAQQKCEEMYIDQ